jgi:GNAT superfamily N-acetyltransferase
MSDQFLKWQRGDFFISTDPALLDLKTAHRFIASSYWAKNIPFELFEKSVRNSLPFGLYRNVPSTDGSGKRLVQIGFARIISDFSTFAYLGDVFIAEGERKQGLSKWLVECVLSHPELQGLRRICLGTQDAHSLYEKYGFKNLENPRNWLEIKVSNPYSGL